MMDRHSTPLRPIPTYNFGSYSLPVSPITKNSKNQLFQPWRQDYGKKIDHITSCSVVPSSSPQYINNGYDLLSYYRTQWTLYHFSNHSFPAKTFPHAKKENDNPYNIGPSATCRSTFQQNDPISQQSLDYPNTIVGGRKIFPCTQCRYTTDRRNNLKRHLLTMHQKSSKLLECCGIVFGTKASLREHAMVFHFHGYICLYCRRRFCRKALLKRHLSVHSGKKDFQCHLCDYATSHKSNLERHRKVHSRQLGPDSEISSVDEVSVSAGLHSSDADLSSAELSSMSDDEIDVSSD